MKKEPKTTRTNVTGFQQLVKWIPEGIIQKFENECGVKTRRFNCTSQLLSLMLGQFLHAFSLNEVCDLCSVHENELKRTRLKTVPKRNTLSNADRTRNPKVAEMTYWAMVEHLQSLSTDFGYRKQVGRLARFKFRKIFAIDSSTIQLTANSMDWAKHRAKKAAVKVHMRTDTACMLPRCVNITPAKPHDSTESVFLCAELQEGDIVIADRAYNDYSLFHQLTQRGIFYVLRKKDNWKVDIVKENPVSKDNIVSDRLVQPADKKIRRQHPGHLREIEAIVEQDGKLRNMVFLTNNETWSPQTIADLYKARWDIELLFKELKQTLQLQDFYGQNQFAIEWQIWTALLVHLLIRFVKHTSKWKGSYTRLVGIIRALIWAKHDIYSWLTSHGIAPPGNKVALRLEAPYLLGFEEYFNHPVG